MLLLDSHLKSIKSNWKKMYYGIFKFIVACHLNIYIFSFNFIQFSVFELTLKWEREILINFSNKEPSCLFQFPTAFFIYSSLLKKKIRESRKIVCVNVSWLMDAHTLRTWTMHFQSNHQYSIRLNTVGYLQVGLWTLEWVWWWWWWWSLRAPMPNSCRFMRCYSSLLRFRLCVYSILLFRQID